MDSASTGVRPRSAMTGCLACLVVMAGACGSDSTAGNSPQGDVGDSDSGGVSRSGSGFELQRVEPRNLLGLDRLIWLERWLDFWRPIDLRRRLELREQRGVRWGRARCRNVTDGRRRRANRWRRRRIGDV